ncbi:MAG: REP-associated tyrosine transposase [Armatimonadota bacterium]
MQRFRIAESGYPYFITCSIVKWLPVFVNKKNCDVIINSLKYCRDMKDLRVHAYVVMPTHIHLIVSTENDLSAILRDFKRFTAKQLVDTYAGNPSPPFENIFQYCGRDNRPPTEHKVWQEGNHPEMIKSREFFLQKAEYIHDNPFRKGLVTEPEAWTYSSVRYFIGTGDGPLSVDWLDW